MSGSRDKFGGERERERERESERELIATWKKIHEKEKARGNWDLRNILSVRGLLYRLWDLNFLDEPKNKDHVPCFSIWGEG